jgi:hypothetical protein
MMTWVYFCRPDGRDAAGYGRQGCPPLQIEGGVRMRPDLFLFVFFAFFVVK